MLTQPQQMLALVCVKGLFTRTVIFSVGCDSHIRHRTKNPIFCAVSDAVVASETENHGSCKQTLNTPLAGCESVF
jgi:hypothetical protein